jgi:hypothetical protein
MDVETSSRVSRCEQAPGILGAWATDTGLFARIMDAVGKAIDAA